MTRVRKKKNKTPAGGRWVQITDVIDDDGDGINTFDELILSTYIVDTNINEEEPVLASNEYEFSRSTSNGIITINTVTAVDSDNNGTPDYLQEDIAVNYNEGEE